MYNSAENAPAPPPPSAVAAETDRGNESMQETTEMTFPGFVDVHVHFRDPGAPDSETTATGLAAARRGGFAAVVTMPNTDPACDSPEGIDYQRRAARASGSETILLPSACITKGRLGREVADLEALAGAGAAFFTDDGSYVEDDAVMEEAMRRAAKLGLCICQHAMDPRLVGRGVVRDCAFARAHRLPTIPVSAETTAIRRDLALCRVTGCRLHVQHLSTAEGVELIRSAQREGLPVTAEATPHHLLLSCDEIPRDDANYKMAPPLGSAEDRAELRRAVKEGALMFATDHAPHSAARKAGGFAGAANGIVGLETAIPLTWTAMVEEEGMDPEAWARAWWKMPRSILSPRAARRLEGAPETRIAVGEWRAVDVAGFSSRSRNCPYDGFESRCRPLV